MESIIVLTALVAYVLSLFLTIKILNHKRYKVYSLPKLILTKNGLKFTSFLTHKIYVGEVKVLQLDNTIYIRKGQKLVTLQNAKFIKLKNGFLMFCCFGKTILCFEDNWFYKYFNLKIEANNFNFNELKRSALLDLSNHLFHPRSSVGLNRYLKFITKTLNIQITPNNIKIRQNKYHLAYCLQYKCFGKTKKLKVNC